MTQTVPLTGTAGYIGSILEHRINAVFKVRAIDRLRANPDKQAGKSLTLPRRTYIVNRLNWKIPASMLAASLALVSLQGCGWNPLGNKQEYLRRAQQFAEKGRYEDAALQYRKALQKDANYGEAYLGYGHLLAHLNRQTEAFDPLSRAVELLPNSAEAKAELGRIAITGLLRDPRRPQRLYQTAAKMATELLAANRNSAEGLRLKGYLALVDSHPSEVIDYFRGSLVAKPNQPDVVTMLVQTLLLEHEGDEAENLARNALGTLKNYGPLYDTLYGYYMGAHRPVDGEQLLKLKIADNPRDPFFIVQLATHYRNVHKAEEMESLLKTFVADTRNYPTAPREAGDFYRQIGNLDEAMELWQKGLQSDPNPGRKKEYLQRLAAGQLAQGRIQDAAALFDRIIKDDPTDAGARASRADLRMATRKPDQMAQAITEFAELLKKTPDDNQIRYSLANAYRQTGNEPEAHALLIEVLRRDPGARNALREMADIAIRGRRPDEALQYAERLLQLDPKNTGARLVRTAAWVLQGRLAEARSELHRLTAENPNSTEAWLQTAELSIVQKNYSEGAKILERLYQPGKGDLRALKALVMMYSVQGEPRKALDLVRAEVKRAADPQVRVLLATSAAQAGEFDLALTTAVKLAADFPGDPDHEIFIAGIYRRKGQLDRAVESFEKARTLAPDNVAINENLAETLALAGRTDASIALYRQTLKGRPDDPLLMNGLAWRLAMATKNLDEAAALEKRALQKDPGNASFLDTSGMILLKSGKLDDALQTFQQLVHREERNPVYRTHLATVLIEMGEPRKARAELEAALRNSPSDEAAEEIHRLLRGT